MWLKDMETIGTPHCGGRASGSPLFRSFGVNAARPVSRGGDAFSLTLQFRPCHSIPKGETPIAATGAESPLALVEGDSIDSEDILRARAGGCAGHGVGGDIVAMAFERVILPVTRTLASARKHGLDADFSSTSPGYLAEKIRSESSRRSVGHTGSQRDPRRSPLRTRRPSGSS